MTQQHTEVNVGDSLVAASGLITAIGLAAGLLTMTAEMLMPVALLSYGYYQLAGEEPTYQEFLLNVGAKVLDTVSQLDMTEFAAKVAFMAVGTAMVATPVLPAAALYVHENGLLFDFANEEFSQDLVECAA